MYNRPRFCVYIIPLVCVLMIVYLYPDPDELNILTWLYHGKQKLLDDPLQQRCQDYSPAFPSAGGPGCKTKCEPKNGQPTYTYTALFLNKTHSWPKDLLENMHLAGSILKKHGTIRSLDTERPVYLHLTFDYYCCYTESEAVMIGKFLNSYRWTPQTVSFDKIVCAIHTHGDLVSLVLMVDEDSEKKMLKYVLENEKELEKTTGIRKNIPHTRLQRFHITLGSVDQNKFPVRSAVKEINRVIRPGHWHRTPVILHRPICRRCDLLISRLT